MKHILPALVILFLISACASSEAATSTPPAPATETPLPTVTPACVSPQPAEEDIERVLSFTEDQLDEEWEQEYAVLDGRVTVTWQNTLENAVLYLEALIFPCGYDEPDLNDYFNDANWDAIFANYDDYEMIGECSTEDGLRLYEFEASGFGSDYDVNYWVLNDSATRVVTIMMIFPFDSEALFDDLSLRLFPQLTAC
jgi:hypothetical protein